MRTMDVRDRVWNPYKKKATPCERVEQTETQQITIKMYIDAAHQNANTWKRMIMMTSKTPIAIELL